MDWCNWCDLGFKAQRGDEAAAKQLLMLAEQLVGGHVRRLTRDDHLVRETVHHVCLWVIDNCNEYCDRQIKSGFLTVMARHYVFGQLRKRRPQDSTWQCPVDISTRNDDLCELEAKEIRRRIRRVLMQLPTRERVALTMRFYVDATYRDIACELNVSERHAARMVERGLNMLRIRLNRMGD